MDGEEQKMARKEPLHLPPNIEPSGPPPKKSKTEDKKSTSKKEKHKHKHKNKDRHKPTKSAKPEDGKMVSKPNGKPVTVKKEPPSTPKKRPMISESESEEDGRSRQQLPSKVVKEVQKPKIKKQVQVKREAEHSSASLSQTNTPRKPTSGSLPTVKEEDTSPARGGDSAHKPTTPASVGRKRKKAAGESSDEEFKPKKAKTTHKAKSTAKRAKTTHTPAKKTPTSAGRRKTKTEPQSSAKKPRAGRKKEEAEVQEVWKWWEEEPLPEGVKWLTLEHKGPLFAPPYEPLPPGVHFLYDGQVMQLTKPAVEAAGFFAKMLDHDYTKKEIFCQNFFNDWRKEMTAGEAAVIKDLSKCDFSHIHEYYKERAEQRKAMSKEEKKKLKEENEKITEEYGWTMVDGHKQKIGNFKIEPPGLFRGRGDHPKQGKIKRRTVAEDVIINIGKKAAVPKPPAGHKWKSVQHDNKVTWLASWTENIQGAIKYVMLNPTSKIKGEKDWQKYETSRRLKTRVDTIRKQYTDDWKTKEMKVRQIGVAMYFIDKLALRAGNEKDSDETADTVGCCSLRVEHIKLHEEFNGKEYVVEFDFLGKDSIRYYNVVPVDRQVFKNLTLFIREKQPSDDLFDRLTTSVLNKYLQEQMEGLTAKVFRTFNASITLQEQLEELTHEDDPIPSKMLSYNRANRAVAILCNHQRAAPKTFEQQLSNLQAKVAAKEEAIIDVKSDIKALKKEARASGDPKVSKKLESKKKRLTQMEEQLHKLEVQATDKAENKEIALGTSKLNYLDPRITIAWCKKHEVPIEKIYNKSQREKFAWAVDMADETFVF